MFGYQTGSASKDHKEWPRRVVTGLQPTGTLHIGNYFGAVRRCVRLQEQGEDLMIFIADLHALTTHQDPAQLQENVLELTACLLASGVDPSRSVLFLQSAVARHAELCWLLTCLATHARLAHLPQYKEKAARMKEVPLGLLLYPVLQAADVLLYSATHVPVGADQLQHLQVASQLVRTFKHRYGPAFPTPEPMLSDDCSERLRSLRDPTKKMSKSDSDPKSRILMTDSDEVIELKIRKAVTDFTPQVTYEPSTRPGVSNLVAIHCLAEDKLPEEVVEEADGLSTAQYKRVVAAALQRALGPVRERARELRARPDLLRDRAGARCGSARASCGAARATARRAAPRGRARRRAPTRRTSARRAWWDWRARGGGGGAAARWGPCGSARASCGRGELLRDVLRHGARAPARAPTRRTSARRAWWGWRARGGGGGAAARAGAVRERARELQARPELLRDVLRHGAARARRADRRTSARAWWGWRARGGGGGAAARAGARAGARARAAGAARATARRAAPRGRAPARAPTSVRARGAPGGAGALEAVVVVLQRRQVLGQRVRVRVRRRLAALSQQRQQVAQQVHGLRHGLGLLLGGQRAAHGGLGQQFLGGGARLGPAGPLRAHVVVQQRRLALLV
ncbi:unnamed protein product [Chrysodeixis includens]|uniref:tryptophan--tRNA ligase n=1 Tax=Chrysodeixis includens TaxID=689277 RepID=A0A9P0BI65_CHRIL|nr:unnamed protein product [Chrysodeixis includens]